MPSPEFEALLQGLGIDPATLSGVADAEDPLVLVGRRPVPPRSVGRAVGDVEYTPERTKPEKKKLSALMKDYWALDPASLLQLQERLWAAGFYGDVPHDRVPFGRHDEVTAKAYEAALGRAVSFQGAGRDLTLDEMLDEAAAAIGDIGEKAGAQAVTNPADLRATFQAVARERIGRKLATDEVERMIASYQSLQAGAQAAAAAGGRYTAAPGAEAFATERAEAMYPGEAGAADLADQGGEFFQLLRSVGNG